jgi:predicted nucleic acid-binding protein
MEKRYLIDSNAIIDYMALRIPLAGSEFIENIFNSNFIVYIVVKIEVLGFADIPDKMSILEEFLDTAISLPIDEEIEKRTILFRRQHKKLKLGDAIIAATAFVHNLTLISRNLSDFKHIDIEVLDLYSL